jgi:transposase
MLAPAGNRISMVLGSKDMRKAINSLSIPVQDRFELNPFSGHLFVCCNCRGDQDSVLVRTEKVFFLWLKRLEKHFFT